MAEIFPASVIENWQLGRAAAPRPAAAHDGRLHCCRSGPRRAVMYGCTGRAGRDGISCGAPRPLQRCGRCCGAVTSGFDPLRKSGGPKCCDAQLGISSSGVVGCNPRTEGAHEALRFHDAGWRCSGVDACGAGAANREDQAHRIPTRGPPPEREPQRLLAGSLRTGPTCREETIRHHPADSCDATSRSLLKLLRTICRVLSTARLDPRGESVKFILFASSTTDNQPPIGREPGSSDSVRY
jgi:hypothetical protein